MFDLDNNDNNNESAEFISQYKTTFNNNDYHNNYFDNSKDYDEALSSSQSQSFSNTHTNSSVFALNDSDCNNNFLITVACENGGPSNNIFTEQNNLNKINSYNNNIYNNNIETAAIQRFSKISVSENLRSTSYTENLYDSICESKGKHERLKMVDSINKKLKANFFKNFLIVISIFFNVKVLGLKQEEFIKNVSKAFNKNYINKTMIEISTEWGQEKIDFSNVKSEYEEKFKILISQTWAEAFKDYLNSYRYQKFLSQVISKNKYDEDYIDIVRKTANNFVNYYSH